jgi:deoxycytidylate deaminase
VESSGVVGGAAESLVYPDAELVIGLVAPVGTDLGEVQRKLEERLKQHFDRSCVSIKLSGLLQRLADRLGPLKLPTRDESEAGRMEAKMDLGDEVREKLKQDDALALAAVQELRQLRAEDPAVQEAQRLRGDDAPVPRPRTVFVLDQLKHPSEVETLRAVYGHGFFLLGVTASQDRRVEYLVQNRSVRPKSRALELIERDQASKIDHGQHTRKTFQLADAFLSLDVDGGIERSLWRILDLFFGHPLHSPTRDEHAMFMAFAASLRSADLSRQVGAVVATKDGDVLSTGANDVPAFGGGQYWPDANPYKDTHEEQRDWVRGCDANAKQRDEILIDIARRAGWVTNEQSDALEVARRKLKGSPLFDLTEFGRAVHAEMAAVTACARNGVSCQGALLFCTTFPCHNCTKHIVAAGISEVVYIEPYPKSKAFELHDDAVTDDPKVQGKVLYRPFVGVAPRRYVDLFSMTLGDGFSAKRKDSISGSRRDFDPKQATPRVPMQPNSYFDREGIALERLRSAFDAHAASTSSQGEPHDQAG